MGGQEKDLGEIISCQKFILTTNLWQLKFVYFFQQWQNFTKPSTSNLGLVLFIIDDPHVYVAWSSNINSIVGLVAKICR